MNRGFTPAVLLCAILLVSPVRVHAFDPGDMISMMRMMVLMMRFWEAMTDSDSWDLNTGMSFPGGMSDRFGSGSRWGRNGSSPWAFPGFPGQTNPVPAMPFNPGSYGPPGMGFFPGAQRPMWPPARAPYNRYDYRRQNPLDGLWVGNGGSALRVEGDRFQLLAGGRPISAGRFMVHGDRWIAYHPNTDVTEQYQFELKGDWLALRDRQGGIRYFQKRRSGFPGMPGFR